MTNSSKAMQPTANTTFPKHHTSTGSQLQRVAVHLLFLAVDMGNEAFVLLQIVARLLPYKQPQKSYSGNDGYNKCNPTACNCMPAFTVPDSFVLARLATELYLFKKNII